MSALAVLCALCLAASAGAGTAGAPVTTGASWPDALHGWARAADGLVCTPRADLCSTNDGGATWHGIFTGDVASFVRTSARAGVVSLTDGRVFWTRDDAQHWYRTRRIFGRFAGVGRTLVAANDTDLYRVTPWPPRGSTRCRSWRAVAGDIAVIRSLLCTQSYAEAGMQDRFLGTVRGTDVAALTSVPGGVFGVSGYADDYSRLNAFVWRNGALRQTALPFPQPGWWCCAEVDAAWPALFVTGLLYSPPGTASDPLGVVWRSGDGGVTWAAYTRKN